MPMPILADHADIGDDARMPAFQQRPISATGFQDESFVGIGGLALAFGLLYWLISVRPSDAEIGSGSQRRSDPNE